MTKLQFPHQQSGYTVVELLIAGTLGLVLLAGVGQLFVGSNQTFRMQRQLADVQDAGRFAIGFLRDEIERAGWEEGNSMPKAAGILNVASGVTPADMCPANICTADGGGDASDAFTVAYGGAVDCLGNAAPGLQVENRYSIGGVDNRQLLCFGNGGAVAQPLIDDVDAMQVLYGLDDNDDQVPDRYVPFSDVPANRIGAITGVRVSLLIAGESNQSIPQQNRVYQVGDRRYEFNDRIPRRVFSITAIIRNSQINSVTT
ncbi:MAG: PilW family protein [Permianibacter sp.]